MKCAKLKEFRQAAYNHLGRAHDVTFELMDAILLTRNAYSLADLSLSPVFTGVETKRQKTTQQREQRDFVRCEKLVI
ncbi:MAG: hypothetical protein EA343_02875 [Nodularia sp. (in: Bacteria)]|nr:MAG: hypothetical protein EA343_02875 [Nodularia sp. (in: cyanobacteria)]